VHLHFQVLKTNKFERQTSMPLQCEHQTCVHNRCVCCCFAAFSGKNSFLVSRLTVLTDWFSRVGTAGAVSAYG
jgi:hypothetical protein